MSNLPISNPIKGPGLTKAGVIVLQFLLIFFFTVQKMNSIIIKFMETIIVYINLKLEEEIIKHIKINLWFCNQ